MTEKFKEKGMASNSVIGDISELAHKFVYGVANVVERTQEKGQTRKKKM